MSTRPDEIADQASQEVAPVSPLTIAANDRERNLRELLLEWVKALSRRFELLSLNITLGVEVDQIHYKDCAYYMADEGG
jgi:hypothetical protein